MTEAVKLLGINAWTLRRARDRMIKRHKKSQTKLMRRTCRVYLNDLNQGKVETLKRFLHLCHDATQYFVDLFWQRQDFSAKLADLETVHQGRDRFGLTTRLAQALAKQAKECVRSAQANKRRKPALGQHTVTLYSHFVTVEPFEGPGFDYAVRLIGSGAPKLVIPVHSTRPINQRLAEGWQMSKTIRLGRNGNRIWIDFIFEKERPARKETGRIVGMDANYKNGLVFSDGQVVGQEIYPRIQQFSKRQKHTHAEIDAMSGQALKQVDWANVKILVIENLKNVKQNKRGTFSRSLNRRLSHWLYRACATRLEQICEENGIILKRKSPFKTSQFCRRCGRWDRRNRKGDKFLCVHCGHRDHADHNAAKNLAYLEVVGAYGLGILKTQDFVPISKV